MVSVIRFFEASEVPAVTVDLSTAVERVLQAFEARQDLPEWFHEAPKFFVLSGSKAYGIDTPTSDIDLLGFVLPPKRVRNSLFSSYEQTTFRVAESDAGPQIEGTLYSLSKLLTICANANPTALEVLWSPGVIALTTDYRPGDSDYHASWRVRLDYIPDSLTDVDSDSLAAVDAAFKDSEEYDFWRLRKNLAKACLTRKIRWTCGGYAVQQFRKIQSHRNWMLGETPEKPTRAAFGLPERPEHWVQAVEAAVTREKGLWSLDLSSLDPAQRIEVEERLQAIVSRYESAGISKDIAVYDHLGLGPEVTERLLAENRYSAAVKAYEGYARWLKERNPVRADLERRFGNDTKHAGHLVRLTRMGIEALSTGELHFDRRGRDADEIRAVRQGAWPWDLVRVFGEAVDSWLADADKASPLPKSPDREAIDRGYFSLIRTLERYY